MSGDELTYDREMALLLAWSGRLYSALGFADAGLRKDPNDFSSHFARAIALNNGYETGLALQDFMLVQIPHHGSRRNVSPAILNSLLGPITPKDTPPHSSAYVSAPKDDDTHPRGMVLIALLLAAGQPSDEVTLGDPAQVKELLE